MKKIKKMILTVVLLIGTNNISAQVVNSNKDGVANNGYDVVNYFTTNAAERGSIEYSTTYKGASYYFVNAEHLKSFDKNPNKFLPQFDGYCAFAVAKMNKKVPADPNTFRIDDGKLFLFYNDLWEGKPFNTIIPWVNNESEMEKMANDNWKTLKN